MRQVLNGSTQTEPLPYSNASSIIVSLPTVMIWSLKEEASTSRSAEPSIISRLHSECTSRLSGTAHLIEQRQPSARLGLLKPEKFAEMMSGLTEQHRLRDEELLARGVAEDIFDIVFSQQSASAESVAFYLFHETTSFLKNILGIDTEALKDIVEHS